MRLILLSSILFLLFSCGDDRENQKDLVKDDIMVRILIDIHIAEGKVNQAKLPLDTALSYYKYLESNIYKKYDVDSAEFNKSMRYYTENIRELDKIYEVVLDSLNLRYAKQDDIEETENDKN